MIHVPIDFEDSHRSAPALQIVVSGLDALSMPVKVEAVHAAGEPNPGFIEMQNGYLYRFATEHRSTCRRRIILGRLRRRIFHSLADVDAALGELMAQLNERQPLRRLGVTRRQLLEEVDRPALKALPGEPYEYSEWRGCRVGIDYHIDVDAHYYSVPYRFARAEVDARITARGVEIFHKGERIAVHLRSSGKAPFWLSPIPGP